MSRQVGVYALRDGGVLGDFNPETHPVLPYLPEGCTSLGWSALGTGVRAFTLIRRSRGRTGEERPLVLGSHPPVAARRLPPPPPLRAVGPVAGRPPSPPPPAESSVLPSSAGPPAVLPPADPFAHPSTEKQSTLPPASRPPDPIPLAVPPVVPRCDCSSVPFRRGLLPWSPSLPPPPSGPSPPPPPRAAGAVAEVPSSPRPPAESPVLPPLAGPPDVLPSSDPLATLSPARQFTLPPFSCPPCLIPLANQPVAGRSDWSPMPKRRLGLAP